MRPMSHVLHVMPGSAPCRAVLLTLETLRADNEVSVEVSHVDLREGEHLADGFLALNPLHTVPTLERVPGEGLRESRAIMRYLCELAERQELYPEDPWERAQVDALLDWDVAIFYKAVGGFVYPQVFRDELPEKEAIDALRDVLHFLDRHQLADERPHLTGDRLTLADLSVAAGASMLELVSDHPVGPEYPNVRRWRERLATVPAWDAVNAPFEAWKKKVRGGRVTADA